VSFLGGRLFRRLFRRLVQIIGQSRIRLPRRPLDPSELGEGDRIQIESAVWRIRGRLLLLSGDWAFLLEPVSGLPEGTPTARLLAPADRPGPWTLIRDGQRFEVPVGCLVIYPAADPLDLGHHQRSPGTFVPVN
jgi:hypothetical protein